MSMVNPQFKILPEEQRLQFLTKPPDHCPLNLFASLVGDERWIDRNGTLQRRSPFEASILLSKSSEKSTSTQKKHDNSRQNMGYTAQEAVLEYLSSNRHMHFDSQVRVRNDTITGRVDGLSDSMVVEVKASDCYMYLSSNELKLIEVTPTGGAWWQSVVGAICTGRPYACIALVYPTLDDYNRKTISSISDRTIFLFIDLRRYEKLIHSRMHIFETAMNDIIHGFTPKYDLNSQRDVTMLSKIDPSMSWQS